MFSRYSTSFHIQTTPVMAAIKDNRRGFLAKFSLGIISMLGLPWVGRSKTNGGNGEADNDPHPVLSVKPMGFSWETLDPFLFCVHHEDKFPQGNDEMGPAVSLKGGSPSAPASASPSVKIIRNANRAAAASQACSEPRCAMFRLPIATCSSLTVPACWQVQNIWLESICSS